MKILYVGPLFYGSTSLQRLKALAHLGHEPVSVDTCPPEVAARERRLGERLWRKLLGPRDLARADPLTRYINEVTRYSELSREEEVLLARRYRETGDPDAALRAAEIRRIAHHLEHDSRELLAIWPKIQRDFARKEFTYTVRGKEIHVPLTSKSLAGTEVPKVELPLRITWHGILCYLFVENTRGGSL